MSSREACVVAMTEIELALGNVVVWKPPTIVDSTPFSSEIHLVLCCSFTLRVMYCVGLFASSS